MPHLSRVHSGKLNLLVQASSARLRSVLAGRGGAVSYNKTRTAAGYFIVIPAEFGGFSRALAAREE